LPSLSYAMISSADVSPVDVGCSILFNSIFFEIYLRLVNTYYK